MDTDVTQVKSATGAAKMRANADSAQKCALGSNGQCSFCQRTGYPILPLRYAVKPAYVTTLNTNLLSLPQMEKFSAQLLKGNRYTLRVLRKGYVHVYLGVRGHWQTYAVTEDGYLRLMKNPDDPDAKADRPLTEACKRDGHNIPASFINIPERYKKVWIGFADVVWRKEVRDAFEAKPDTRMQHVDCTALAANPAQHKHALEVSETAAELHNFAEEYALDDKEYRLRLTYPAKVWMVEKTVDQNFMWESLHGNFPRAGQLAALGSYVKAYSQKTLKQFGAARKTAAVVLADPVGIVQELNSARLHFIQFRQNYTDLVMRPLVISKSILGLKAYFEKAALAARTVEEKKKNLPDVQTVTINQLDPALGVGGVGTTYTTSRKERAEQDAAAAWSKIAKRYSEAKRSAFDARYQEAMKKYSEEIKEHAHDWSLWAKDSAWLDHLKDYRTRYSSDYVALVQAYAPALAGGAGEDTYTQSLWEAWINAKVDDPNTPIWPALFGKRMDLIAYLVPADGEVNKGDKLYDISKNLVASEQGEGVQKKIREVSGGIKQSLTQIMLAISASVGRLESKINPQAALIAHRATQAAIILYNDVEPIFIKVQMTVREYQRLLSDLAFQAAGKARKEVGSLVLAGLMSINNARVRDTLVEVTLWTFEKAATINAMLEKVKKEGTTAVNNVIRSVEISSVIISQTATRELGGLGRRVDMSLSQASEFTRSLMSKGLRVGSQLQEPLLAGGAVVFQAWAFKGALKEVKEKLGADGDEAQLSLISAGIGVLAATTETAATVFKIVGKDMLGRRLFVAAGLMGAISGIVDAIQSFSSSQRAGKHGDKTASDFYLVASMMFVGSAVASGTAAVIGSSTLFGPIGVALVLVGLGIAATWYAMNSESTQAEMWADRCYFGENRNQKGLWTDAQMIEEMAELNAIIAGLRIEMGTRSMVNRLSGALDFDGHLSDNVRLKISFGMFDQENSAYEWEWYAKHKKYGNVRLYRDKYGNPPWPLTANATKPLKQSDISWPTVDPYVRTYTFDEKGNVAVAIERAFASIDSREFSEISLKVNYWPDSSDMSCLTGTVVNEEL